MQQTELEKHIDFLLAAALRKCDNLEDARDLTQESLMAALKYLSEGKIITDYKAFLSVVLKRRFNDYLRKKYKLPTVYLGTVSDMMDVTDDFDSIYDSAEAEQIRHQIMFLSEQYRNVIVRHYINGESVDQIAHRLNTPQGTVKSRLFNGREHIKKGINSMERYTAQSYAPERLWISCSGKIGFNNEPFSLVKGMIEANLLIIAYEKPLTVEELAMSIGIAAAYIEPIIDALIEGELVKRVGNKVFTDFVIYTIDEKLENLPKQKTLVRDNGEALWFPIKMGLAELHKNDWYAALSHEQRAKCDYYFVMHTLDIGLFASGGYCYDELHEFPDRPNGGQWIAFGHKTPLDFDWDSIDYHQYIYSGERAAYTDQMPGIKGICLYAFGTPLEQDDYLKGKVAEMGDADLAQLLFLFHTGTDMTTYPFLDLHHPLMAGSFYHNIPHLKKCGVLKTTDGKTAVDIPVLTKAEYHSLTQISKTAADAFISVLVPPLKKHLESSKKKIPPHLKSVPIQKLYLEAMYCIPIALVKDAMNRECYRKDVDFPCPPMVLVIEE